MDALARHRNHVEGGNAIPLAEQGVPEGRFQYSVSQLVAPKRAEHRVAAAARHRRGIAGDDTGLRSAKQFVSAEGDEVVPAWRLSATTGSSMPQGRRSTRQPLPEIFVERKSRSLARAATHSVSGAR